MSTLIVTGSHDYSGDNLSNITEIDFNNTSAASIVFVASQFDNTHISQSVHASVVDQPALSSPGGMLIESIR